MKKVTIWSMLMLAVLALPMLTACGGDDDGGGGNGGANYTSEEIVELLTGKWAIYGHAKLTDIEGLLKEGDYTGTIEFKSDQKFTVTSSTLFEFEGISANGQVSNFPITLKDLLDNYRPYSVLKKNGKTYISFGDSTLPMTFQIQSITKSSFKLVLDENVYDSNDKSKVVGHIYISMIAG